MSGKKTIMILGASKLQLPAILTAKDMGLRVLAVDMDANALGFKYADASINVSTIDIPKVIEAAREHRIDAIMTLCTDMPIRTVAAVSRELDIVGVSEETALKATNKASMRAALRLNGVPIPLFFKVSSREQYTQAIQNFKDKFIVKPADNSGSRGVYLVEDVTNNSSVNFAFDYAAGYSRSGELVVEEYMEGKEVSVETLSTRGTTCVIAITDKLTMGPPNFVEMGHSIPTSLPVDTQSQIEQVAIAAVEAIGIENGPSHTEIIITKDGPKVVELGARLGGDNITTHLVPLATGIDLVKACIQIALGDEPNVDKSRYGGAAIRYLRTAEGRVEDVMGVSVAKGIKGVKEIDICIKTGDLLKAVRSSVDRTGHVIAQSANVADAIMACERALNSIEVIYG